MLLIDNEDMNMDANRMRYWIIFVYLNDIFHIFIFIDRIFETFCAKFFSTFKKICGNHIYAFDMYHLTCYNMNIYLTGLQQSICILDRV